MQKYPTLSSRERVILTLYGLGALLVLVLYLFLGWLRDTPTVQAADPGAAEIAVLVPLKGTQAQLGQSVLNVVQKTLATRYEELNLDGLRLSVQAYDTGSTPDQAATAARRAARNGNTVAIIGPLDTRQILAALESMEGNDLVLVSPSSNAPFLPPGRYPNLFRIPSVDTDQANAIVDFLVETGQLDRKTVYLVTEQFETLDQKSFEENLADRFEVIATTTLPAEELVISELIDAIQTHSPEIVAYLGDEDAVINELRESLVEVGLEFVFIHNSMGRSLARSLDEADSKGIYLVAEPSRYVQNVVATFNQISQDRLRIAGVHNLGQDPLPDDFGEEIIDTHVGAVVYMGDLENAQIVLTRMKESGAQMPFIGLELLNRSELLPLPQTDFPVYYTTSIMSLATLVGDESLADYRQVLGELATSPLAYETTQATLAVLQSLSGANPQADLRRAVRTNIPRTKFDGLEGITHTLAGGRRTPRDCYIYAVDPDGNWNQNKLVYVYRGR
jgi:ABC-type branched-subunit amino acid transport system substrate-binding protein